VNAYSEADLSGIIFNYGDEKFARSIAKNIVKSRTEKPIETTFELVDIIKKSMPAKAMRDGHPARRTFQAIRIEVNDEIRILENSVEAMFEGLEIGGTLSIITFHSLEDRVVKNIFRELCMGCTCPKEFPVCVCNKTPRGKIKHKPITASEEELKQNPRARSAKLRSIIRLK
jgi:16S rRNA (cytosine1402-N4)-methyltransferase